MAEQPKAVSNLQRMELFYLRRKIFQTLSGKFDSCVGAPAKLNGSDDFFPDTVGRIALSAVPPQKPEFAQTSSAQFEEAEHRGEEIS